MTCGLCATLVFTPGAFSAAAPFRKAGEASLLDVRSRPAGSGHCLGDAMRDSGLRGMRETVAEHKTIRSCYEFEDVLP